MPVTSGLRVRWLAGRAGTIIRIQDVLPLVYPFRFNWARNAAYHQSRARDHLHVSYADQFSEFLAAELLPLLARS